MIWSDPVIIELRSMWTEGVATSEMGRRLGVSKNAIVGKAHRMELDPRPSPIRRDPSKPPAVRIIPYRPLAALPSCRQPVPPLALRSPPPARAIIPQVVTPLPTPPPPPFQRRASSCCWPIGNPGTKLFRYCGDAGPPGKSYCLEHAKLAYVKVRDRSEDAA